MKTVTNSMFGYENNLDSLGYAVFKLLSPRKPDGNYPERTTKTQLTAFDDACYSLGILVDHWCNEYSHVTYVKNTADLDNLVKALEIRGFQLAPDLMY